MLTIRELLLNAVADHWGGVNVGSFAERLLLQKRIFFLSMLGIDLGFVFSWYIHGPYSPVLTKDAFEINGAKQGGSITEVKLPEPIANQLKRIFETFGDHWNDPVKMELLASVLYLSKTLNSIDSKVIVTKLRALKGRKFNNDEGKDAVEWLQMRNFIDG